MIKRLTHFFEQNEKILSPAFLLGGFILDSLTIRRPDLLAENILVIFYLITSAVAIVLINMFDAGKLTRQIWHTLRPWLILYLSFAFGGIFSVFTVFFVKSASIWHSFPFLILLVLIMLATEFMKKFFNRLSIQIAVLFLALFCVSIYVLPILLHRMGDSIFILGGITSLIIIGGFVHLLIKLIPEHVREWRHRTVIEICAIFILMNIMYFTNIIPPIPLAMKQFDFYSSVTKNGENYDFKSADKHFNFLKLKTEIRLKQGAPVFAYSSVFSPTKLNARIFHNWQFKNKNGDWETVSRIGFPILGGRDGGYRGYTVKNNLQPGDWRIRIENERGQVIGQKFFVVKVIP